MKMLRVWLFILCILIALNSCLSCLSRLPRATASPSGNLRTGELLSGITDNQTFVIQRRAGCYPPPDTILALIPPNSRVTKTERLSGNSTLLTNGELFLRCYKFAYFVLNISNSDVDKFLVTVSPTGPLMLLVLQDELADPFIQALKGNCDVTNLNGVTFSNVPVLSNYMDEVTNLEMADQWKAYPTYNVSKLNPFELPKKSYQYVVIVPSGWQTILDQFVAWKAEKGINVFVADTNWIYNSYQGADDPSKIREFIKDAFNAWRIRYVLLAASEPVIPTRYCWTLWGSTYENCSTDKYYPNLDSSWDSDGNGVYGETIAQTSMETTSDVDWLPEVAIGRLPVENNNELSIIISKILNYEQFPAQGEWKSNALDVEGAYLLNYTQALADENYTWIQFPFLNIARLLADINLTSVTDVANNWNQGQSIVYANTHGSPSGWLVSSGTSDNFLDSSDADSLSNGNKLPVVFSEGCNTALYIPYQQMAYSLLKNPSGGAVLYYGHDYGGYTESWILAFLFGGNYTIPWYPPSNIAVSLPPGGFRVGTAAFQALFEYFNLGRISNHWPWGDALLGDPEMSIWTCNPQNLTVLVPTQIQQPEVVIKVVDSTTLKPVPSVTLRLVTNDSWTELVTDNVGQAFYKLPISEGSVNVDIYALFRNQPTKMSSTFNIATTYTLTAHTQKIAGGKPIQGVNITVYREGVPVGSALTNEDGNAVFQLQAGTYTIIAKRYLFWKIYVTKEQTVEITGDTTVVFTFLL